MHYLKQFPKEVFVNFYKQAIAPFSASKQQWLIGSAVTATSFALIPVDAFPSVHTGAAFSIASVFAMQYNQTPLVPIIAYATATLVSSSRMTEHTH